jgi:hypothetical protein
MDGTKRFNVIEWRSFSRSGSSRGDLRAAPGKIVCAKRRIRLNTAHREREHWPLAQPLLVALDLAHRSGRGVEVLNAWTGLVRASGPSDVRVPPLVGDVHVDVRRATPTSRRCLTPPDACMCLLRMGGGRSRHRLSP